MWELEVRHDELKKYRRIRSTEKYMAELKVQVQKKIWDQRSKEALELEKSREPDYIWYDTKQTNINIATAKSKAAIEQVKNLEDILNRRFKVNDSMIWGELLDKKPYSVKRPSKPEAMKFSAPPKKTNSKYQPQYGFLDAFFPKNKAKSEADAEELFSKDYAEWLKTKSIEVEQSKKIEDGWMKAIEVWEKGKEKYKQNQSRINEKFIDRKKTYSSRSPDAVIDYCDMVLANSQYPVCFSPDWKLDYQSDSRIIVVDYSLPSLDDLPKIKAVKYVATRDEFVETFISAAELNRLYDSVLYQIALRTIHELFEADAENALSSIVFNGWVYFIEKSTGRDSNACVLSVQAEKDEFMAINLERVDPKACFVQLKGVGSSKLHGLTPIAPIINTNTQDKRFVSSYEVANKIDESVNLAAIDWQDFENLIREIFEKEFSSNGGEVKITQASRDGGVDAVAFDPDPIRGGKIVIQAKRYTNVVGVSAVRDLYGTTMNEGATKGILVTTANYGPDAYEFAKGKPLTLLNGSNLLHLLEKHGHKAKIDLKEAKAILNAEKN